MFRIGGVVYFKCFICLSSNLNARVRRRYNGIRGRRRKYTAGSRYPVQIERYRVFPEPRTHVARRFRIERARLERRRYQNVLHRFADQANSAIRLRPGYGVNM